MAKEPVSSSLTAPEAIRLTDVQEVHPVSTADDIDIPDLLLETLKATELNNLRARVRWSEDKQTCFATIEELGIEHAAYTRSDLMDGLKAELNFLWNNFIREEDDNLSPRARSLKETLIRYFQELPE